MMENKEKLEKYIGLCRAAGGAVVGFDLILGEIRGGRAKIVLISSDASDRTKKQLTDKCTFYSVPHVITEFDAESLGRIIGKSACAAIALNGRGCWAKVAEYYKENK